MVWDFLVSHRSSLLTSVIVPFSVWSAPRYVFVLLCVVAAWHRRFSTLIPGILALVASPLLKYLFARPRPPLAEQLVHHFDGAMPSGHALMAGAVAMLVWLNLGWRWGSIAWSWALAVAFSRLYLGVHWLTDVVVGLVLGALLTLGCHKTQLMFGKTHTEE
ncbi:PAP2 superfamily protein [Corynebacterium epidermidicanis]|uniref:PAP2 superfamily protein n=1 Tax=Corynebacterium epidermidicanis TaxID=1050174 RepID=A0A0G3GST2_9CORY|nr:PAP2 superfamily protein [Corynebacterium epidermidicanis]